MRHIVAVVFLLSLVCEGATALPRSTDFDFDFANNNKFKFADDGKAFNGPSSFELFDYDPVANPKAVVSVQNARFTVLTEHVIRMEYSASNTFEDRPTVAVLNRNLSIPIFEHSTTNNVLTIETGSLKLSYTIGEKFSPLTLSVKSVDSTSEFNSWSYGDVNSGNLLGTIKSLDMLGVETLNCTQNANKRVHDESLHCEWGVISRDGWAVIDDSDNWALSKGAEWWDSVNTDDQDLYFFGHGTNYISALRDFVSIAGKISMVPRYITGVFFTRWFDLNNVDVKEYIEDYQQRGFPLDVFIFDMNWHTKYHWGGYTPDPHLYPFPNDTFDYIHNEGLHIAANLHDDDGVHNTEQTFVAMCHAMGLDPDTTSQIAFSAINKTYVYSLEDIVLGSVPIDFWWIDWQQGGTQGGCAGGKQNPTIWTDKIRSTDPKRQGKDTRGVVLARFGGLGSHRYQVGFSGDVAGLTWKNLAYQPYFSFTASNVGYGFWSHDIVGPSDDLELYTRWIQWGAYSAVMRSHDRGMSGGACADANSCAIVRPWNIPTKYFRVTKEALLNREELVPYIYTAYRQAFDTGMSILRPMYYYYPDDDLSYNGDENGNFPQYLFGDDMIVSPIVSAANTTSQMTEQSVFLPIGDWVEKDTGVVHFVQNKGYVLTKSYDLSEVPVFVLAGAVIPRRGVSFGDTIGVAKRQYTSLSLDIYPGTPDFSTKVYEDDGETTGYTTGEYVWTSVSYTRSKNGIVVTISSSGSYSSFPKQRNYKINILNAFPIESANVNGQKLRKSRFGGDGTFSYNGNDVTAVVETGTVSTGSTTTLSVTFIADDDAKALSGVKGMINHAILAKRNLDDARQTPGSQKPQGGNLMSLASKGEALSYVAHHEPENFMWHFKQIPSLYNDAVNELVNGPNVDPSPTPDNALYQQFSSATNDNILCGTLNCLEENIDATRLRIEGFMPSPNTPNTVPLYLYWNQVQTSAKDNLVTTSTKPPAGYVAGDFGPNGNVFTSNSSASGLIALQLWYKQSINDHLTVASAAGVAYAKSNGYTLQQAELGFIFASDPNTSSDRKIASLKDESAVGAADSRMQYSIALLKNAIN
eukprot:m.91505 g.91505  ORF g.91505 m.91505 type:complete len:1088 (-) comp12327_c0_seq1:202-3465(-)